MPLRRPKALTDKEGVRLRRPMALLRREYAGGGVQIPFNAAAAVSTGVRAPETVNREPFNAAAAKIIFEPPFDPVEQLLTESVPKQEAPTTVGAIGRNFAAQVAAVPGGMYGFGKQLHREPIKTVAGLIPWATEQAARVSGALQESMTGKGIMRQPGEAQKELSHDFLSPMFAASMIKAPLRLMQRPKIEGPIRPNIAAKVKGGKAGVPGGTAEYAGELVALGKVKGPTGLRRPKAKLSESQIQQIKQIPQEKIGAQPITEPREAGVAGPTKIDLAKIDLTKEAPKEVVAGAGEAKDVKEWTVTTSEDIIIGGRKTPESVERIFTVQAKTAASARKSVLDAGHKNIVRIEATSLEGKTQGGKAAEEVKAVVERALGKVKSEGPTGLRRPKAKLSESRIQRIEQIENAVVRAAMGKGENISKYYKENEARIKEDLPGSGPRGLGVDPIYRREYDEAQHWYTARLKRITTNEAAAKAANELGRKLEKVKQGAIARWPQTIKELKGITEEPGVVETKQGKPLPIHKIPKAQFIESRVNPKPHSGVQPLTAEYAAKIHEQQVYRAKGRGKEIPPEVLKDYPALMQRKSPPTEMHAGVTPADVEASLKALSSLKVLDDIKRVVAPATRTKASKLAGQTMRAHLGVMAHETDLAEYSLREARKAFARTSFNNNMDFIDRIELGQPQANSRLQRFADTIREGFDERREKIRALGTGKLEHYMRNYFGHVWKDFSPDMEALRDWNAKKSMAGSKAFLKKRIFPTMREGMEYGLTPVSENAVDIALIKMREMDKYIMATRTLQELKDNRLVSSVHVGHEAPEGWAKLNDRMFSVFEKRENPHFKGPEGEAVPEWVKTFEQYAPESVATIINNYLTIGPSQKSQLWRLYRGTGNLINQAQLGFSAYHLGFTSLDAVLSKMASAINRGAHGDIIGAGRSMAEVPMAPFSTFAKGNKLWKEWFKPETQSPKVAQYVKALEAGGGRVRMDAFYRTKITERALDAWRKGNPMGAAWRLPGIILEQSARPIMEYLVPRQKLGVFMDLARMEMERNPKMSQMEKRATMNRIWDSMDNRMGQMVYDNVFWNATTKELAMASIRSVGWNLGTIREVGGGLSDMGMQVLKAVQGKRPEMTYRMAYTISLPIVVGTLGAMTQYLLTGQPPKDLKDLYFPRTGGIDENGNPQRLSMPSYMKDIYHYAKAPLKTIKNKLHPLIGIIADMISNEDFYGTQIRNQDDPFYKQLLQVGQYAGKQSVSFGIRNVIREYKAEGGMKPATVLPFVGITPAPYDVNMTAAEKLARKYVMESMPRGSRTSQQAEEAQMKSNIRRDLKQGKLQSLEKAAREGKLSKREYDNLVLSASKSSLQRSMNSLPLDKAIKVWDVATPQERKEIADLLLNKVTNFWNSASPDEKATMEPMIRRVADEFKKIGMQQ